jgi:hypothetical protein
MSDEGTTTDVAVAEDTNVVTGSVELAATETAEVEQAFAEAQSFRTIGERITAPIDSIITETARVIDKDPIMNVSDELTRMNGEVQEVYGEIINDDGTVMKLLKSIPVLNILAKMLDKKFDEASFNMKSIEGKIGVIFEGFDTSYDSVNTSIDLQKKFLDGIDANL